MPGMKDNGILPEYISMQISAFGSGVPENRICGRGNHSMMKLLKIVT
jgi:hypothetical protein